MGVVLEPAKLWGLKMDIKLGRVAVVEQRGILSSTSSCRQLLLSSEFPKCRGVNPLFRLSNLFFGTGQKNEELKWFGVVR